MNAISRLTLESGNASQTGFFTKWWTYQRERFPILMYSLLVAAFSYSGLCLSMVLRNAPGLPNIQAIVVSFVVTLLLFAQLRIADEFKDHEDDCLYQPERPVPRGLISLKELGLAGVLFGLVQIVLTAWLMPKLLGLLFLTWGYFALMGKEFFARDWLRRRPFLYLVSHNFILVCIDLYITGCDWMVAGSGPPSGLVLFLFVSTLNGAIIEIGRKLRAPKDERPGVETYTHVWGLKRASAAWLASISLSAIFVFMTAERTGFVEPVACMLSILLLAAFVMVANFIKRPQPAKAKFIEGFSSLWILCMYISLGIAPAVMRLFQVKQ